jgi:hypothetical protein
MDHQKVGKNFSVGNLKEQESRQCIFAVSCVSSVLLVVYGVRLKLALPEALSKLA